MAKPAKETQKPKSYWEAEFELDQAVKSTATKEKPSLKQRFIGDLSAQINLVGKKPGKNDPDPWFAETADKKWHLVPKVGNSKLTPKPILLPSLEAVKKALEKIKADTEASKLDSQLDEIAEKRRLAGERIRAAVAANKKSLAETQAKTA